MADPTLPTPWQPAQPAVPSNPWTVDAPANLWDLKALLDQINRDKAARIKEAFGRDISLSALIDLLARFSLGQLSDVELVDVIEMGIYFARSEIPWPEAAANLEYWLVAGRDAKPARQMDHELIMGLDYIVGTLCDEHYDAIVAGVNSRLMAPAGTQFPEFAATFKGPSGEEIVVAPAASPLRAGGEETLYKDASTLPVGDRGDIYNAVGAVTLVSRATVKSEALDTGGWRVRIVDWECWFWDTYDWNKGVSVRIPINLFDRLGVTELQRSVIESALSVVGSKPSWLKELEVKDETMKQIDGKQIRMPDDRVVQPKAFLVYGDSSWRFDAAASCGKPIVLTIAPQ